MHENRPEGNCKTSGENVKMSTKIEWAEETWNPITGCTPISEGCKNCYAKKMAYRLKGRFGYDKDEPFKLTFHEDKMKVPRKWKKPRKIFVGSMGDLFHSFVHPGWLDNIIEIISECPQHTFIILTKRPENIKTKLYEYTHNGDVRSYDYRQNENLWIGVSIENQRTADERIPLLLKVPAAKRFVSIEPLLDHIGWRPSWDKLDWVICGAETGQGKRHMDTKWAIEIKDQCKDAGIPFFFKKDSKGSHKLNGKIYEEIPE